MFAMWGKIGKKRNGSQNLREQSKRRENNSDNIQTRNSCSESKTKYLSKHFQSKSCIPGSTEMTSH